MKEEVIKSIFNLKGTTLQIKLDILDVYLGYRKGARILCHINEQIEGIAKELITAEIQIAVGKGMVSQIANSVNKVKDYFDNNSENTERVVPFYIAKNQDYADKLRETDESKSDVEFGRMLDYPDCCINKVAESGHVPSIIESFHYLQENGKFNVWTWPVAMIGDASFLVHYPCSSKCLKSMDIAKKHFQLIANYAPKNIVARVEKYHSFNYSIDNGIISIHEKYGSLRPLNDLYEVS
jgi:hypothetical protein